MLGVESDQDVAKHNRSKEVSDWRKETLVQVVAQFLQAEHVGFHLLRRGFCVHLKTASPRRADRYSREAVVVTGNAGCLRNEIRIGPLNQGKTSLDCALNGVLAPGFEGGRAAGSALRAVFDQLFDN